MSFQQFAVFALLIFPVLSNGQIIRGVQFAELNGAQVGSSEIVYPVGIEGKAKCGITSKFWGKQNDGATVEGRIISNILPESFCDENVTDAILLWPNRIWDLDATIREQYSCGKNFDKAEGVFFLDFYRDKGLKGIIFAGDIPNFVSSLGFLYTDDLGFSRTVYKDLDFYIFECSFPANWESTLLSSAENSTVIGSFTMEADLPFRTTFASWYYFILYTVLIPLAHFFVVCVGAFAFFVHIRSSKKTGVMAHIPMTVISINMLTSFILGTVMIAEGWWRTGNYSSLLRDSFSNLFIGPLTGSGLLIVVVWVDFVGSWKRGMSRVSKPIVSRYRGRLVAMGVCMFSIPITTTVLITTRTVRLIDIQVPLVGFLVLIELILTAFFISQSRKFTALVVSMISSNDTHAHKSDSAMLEICKLIRFAGYALAYLILSTGFMATDLLVTDSTMWTIFWFNYHFSRVVAGFAMIRVASKNKSLFTRQMTSKMLTMKSSSSSSKVAPSSDGRRFSIAKLGFQSPK